MALKSRPYAGSLSLTTDSNCEASPSEDNSSTPDLCVSGRTSCAQNAFTTRTCASVYVELPLSRFVLLHKCDSSSRLLLSPDVIQVEGTAAAKPDVDAIHLTE